MRINNLKRSLPKAAVLGLIVLTNLAVVGSHSCSNHHQKESISSVPQPISSPSITPLLENIKPAPSLTSPSSDAKDLPIPSPIPQTTPPLSSTTDSSFKADAEKGMKIFYSTGCIGCHMVGGIGGNVGPDLTEIVKRNDVSYIKESIAEPKAYIVPGYPPVMPSAKELNLKEEEIAHIVAWLIKLK